MHNPKMMMANYYLLSLHWIFPFEEEMVMQHSTSKYFPQFENQGINPVEEYLKILHKHKNLLPTLSRGCQSLIDCLPSENWKQQSNKAK